MTFRRRLLPAIGLAVAALGVAATSFAAPVGPAGSVPATGTPALSSSDQNQYVRQLVPCGNTMYAVGTITSITQNGSTSTRTGAFSFSAAAPYTVTSWAPSINGTVDSIAFLGGDCFDAYLGGKFTTVNGTAVQEHREGQHRHRASWTRRSSDAAVGEVADRSRLVNGHLLRRRRLQEDQRQRQRRTSRASTPRRASDDGYLRLGISGSYVYPRRQGQPDPGLQPAAQPRRHQAARRG